jgi:hypothetical protein
MSIGSLTTLAIEREKAPPQTVAKGGSAGAANGQLPQTFKDALTSAIPTEPLAAYTAAIGLLTGISASSGKYLPFRWSAFALFLIITGVSVELSYTLKRKSPGPVGVTAANAAADNPHPKPPRTIPALEIFAALLAATAWGLAMPGSALNTQLTGNVATISAGAIAIGGAAILALVSLFLPKASKTTTATKAPQPAPAQ